MLGVVRGPAKLCILATVLGGPAALSAAGPEMLATPDSIAAKNVPAIPRSQLEGLLPYENIRAALLTDWHPTERRLLIRTRFSETPQLHEVAAPMGARTQLTFYNEMVMEGLYRPGKPQEVVFSLNAGGAENFQLYLLDRSTGRTRRFTDGIHRYVAPVWSRQGKWLAYGSNARNGRDSDLYVADPSTPGSERRLAEVKGDWTPLDWSPDDRQLLVHEFISVTESYLHAVDVETGAVRAMTPRGAGETAAYQGGLWARDGKSVYTLTDRGSEFIRLVRLDPAGGAPQVLSRDIPWNVEEFDLSDDGGLVAFSVNQDGISRLHLQELEGGRELPLPELPAGVINGLRFRPGSREIAFGVNWARSPADAYTYDPGTKRLERWTASETGGLPAESFAVPELVRYPTFDKRTIPAFVYRPAAGRFPGKRPVYINIHGGPEAQSRPVFLQSMNALLDELGVVLIYPNVRGSTGYGKTYVQLDDGRKREDSVKDIGALLDWIAQQPDLDASRVMVGGGSYGGYMVLASLTFYSDRLCCAFDSVGISNFVTFLENTQEYRRDLRRAEYGDERDPEMRAFLQEISPATRADRIKRPLLVAQGANDPRVPLSESDQIVAAVERQGVPVWYIVGKDEGHGFQKKTNTDYQRAVLYEFIRRYLIGGK